MTLNLFGFWEWTTAISLLAAIGVGILAYRLLARSRRLSRKLEKLRQSIDSLPVGFYRSSPNGTQISANPALVRLNGYSSEEELLKSVKDISTEWYVDPNRRTEFKRILERDGHVTDFVSEIYRHKTRERIWISEDARLVRALKTGLGCYYEGTVRDVTESIHRKQLEERLDKLARNLPGGLFQMCRNPDGNFELIYASQRFLALLGMEHETFPIDPTPYLGRIHSADRQNHINSVTESAEIGEVWTSDFRYRDNGGSWIWLGATATPERLTDGRIIWHGYIADLSDRKRAEAKIERLAYFDSLTGLPNRRYFTDQLEQTVRANKRTGDHSALLYLDLDNFKSLNDGHGHEIGDRLLQEVAKRLKESARARDTVSRFGGDEFVVLLDNLGSDRTRAAASASGAANKILRAFGRGFDLGKFQHFSTPSIGVALFDASCGTANDIIKGADVAMYEAKKRGRNNFVLFDPSGLQSAAENYRLQRELAGAIGRGELGLEFQPQVDLSGNMFGAEALVRWNHPTRGMLAPREFVPIAEMTGAITDINEWVFRESLDVLARWKRNPHLRDVCLSVNVSVQQFRSPEFAERLCTILENNGVSGSQLTLEMTEHAMARDAEAIAERMRNLKRHGVRFSLDDFGTGHSSLSQLNSFPFDEVKIDGAFVARIEHGKSDRTLIEAILGMAAALGLDTVAEHVGNQQQLDFLRTRGCSRFQGFYFHPPMSEGMIATIAEKQSTSIRASNDLPQVAAPSLAAGR